MKKITILLLLISLSFSVFSQKSKSRSIPFKVMHLPEKPLAKSIKTYSVLVNNSSTEITLKEADERTYLAIKGFERGDIGSTDLKLEFKIFAVNTEASIKNKKVTEKVNDKDVEKTKYYYSVSSKTIADFYLKNAAGEEIEKFKYNGGDFLYTDNSSNYNTKNEASAAYNKNKIKILVAAKKAGLNSILKDIQHELNKNYGYYEVTENGIFCTGKGKKMDYTIQDTAFAMVSRAADLISPKNVPEEAKAQIYECIEIWKSTIDEYEAGNKKAKISDKNVKDFYRNIAYAYRFIDEYDNAIEWIKKSMEVKLDKNEKYEARIRRDFEHQKKLYNLDLKRENE